MKSIVCDTSEVPPAKGLIIRGLEISKLVNRLPEEIFWLLLTSKLPTPVELSNLQEEIKAQEDVPNYVFSVLDAMPETSHPMTMLNTSILVMQNESLFAKEYSSGKMVKSQYWEPTYDDAISIIAKMPAIAAAIYRKKVWFFFSSSLSENNRSDL